MAELDQGHANQLAITSARDADETIVLSVAGQLDISNADSLQRALSAAVEQGPRLLVFDLEGLEFMDSAGISVLVRARSEVPEVRLRKPTPIVRRLIEITGLTEILPIDA